MTIRDLKDRRKKNLISVADYERARGLNLKGGYWTCVCGGRKFHLLQQTKNVKAICSKCGNTDIIYWNGPNDSATGSMLKLDTRRWVKPFASIRLEEL